MKIARELNFQTPCARKSSTPSRFVKQNTRSLIIFTSGVYLQSIFSITKSTSPLPAICSSPTILKL